VGARDGSGEDARRSDPRANDGPEAFSLVVVGGGSAGKYVAQEAAEAGRTVALVESDRVGGECPYVSCMPSKALLHEARERRAGHRPGFPAEAWKQAIAHRDAVASGRDDTNTAELVSHSGVEIVRGSGQLIAPTQVRVTLADGRVRELSGLDLLIATGSEPVLPPIDGLAQVDVWTSARLLSDDGLPERLVILGGGAVGCELAQVYSAYGVDVTVLESAPRLFAQEDPEVSAAMAEVLLAAGAHVLTGSEAVQVDTTPDGGVRVHLANGRNLIADRLLVAAGRAPRVAGLGLGVLGLAEDKAIPVDLRNRVRGFRHVFAAGDVVDLGAFTHVADHHARIVLAELGVGGRARDRDDRAIARVAYTDPPLAAVGLTAARARDQGIDVISHASELNDTARAHAEGSEPPGGQGTTGVVVVHANRATGEVIGAAAVGPAADSWIAELTLAIRARVPLVTLTDLIHPFPTWSEALLPAYDALLGATTTAPSAST
jgi:pyruvate/2-oxoglutarate dehydrogenase complex dihydrolipoamide dehydrogenase (E3) component